jgi:hypothetical protein
MASVRVVFVVLLSIVLLQSAVGRELHSSFIDEPVARTRSLLDTSKSDQAPKAWPFLTFTAYFMYSPRLEKDSYKALQSRIPLALVGLTAMPKNHPS